ncbi:hypothetical protein L1787_18545 [Acuticoccus sp. M5D2P5]|uniref:hypothetical protein n=1 Tax=Acuticoccus kalidii TaxID=2910977 RepID=UPI001F2E9982|nr:hypothetical protein [Acuticoccus kalidii]MCF3935393.1 hypothetical protein [Acuticoccus kalidii]
MSALFLLLGGWRGLLGIAAGVAIGASSGYLAGRWAESHATAAKIEAALSAAILQQSEVDNDALDATNRARRDAARDADAGRLLDDDGFRRP